MLLLLALLAQQDSEPLPFRTKTKDLSSFCYRTQIPEYWQVDDKFDDATPSFHLHRAPRGEFSPPVVVEVLFGATKEPREVLRLWLEKKMPTAYDPDFKPLPVEVRRSDRFRLTTGATLESLTVAVKERHGTSIRHGYLVMKEGVSIFIGSEWSWIDEDRKRDIKEWETVLKEMISVVSNAAFEIPPARETWTAWLAAKGTFSAWSSGNTTASSMQIVSERRRIWTFGKDGRFAREADNYLGLSGGTTTGPTWNWIDPTIGTWKFDEIPSTLTKEGNRKAAGTYEVRGRSDEDLWIVAYHKDGPVTFHRMDPAHTRVYFDAAYQVTAIDGRPEGRHEYGSGYSIYTPPPGAPRWSLNPGYRVWAKNARGWVRVGDDRVSFSWHARPPTKEFAPFFGSEYELVDGPPRESQGPCRVREKSTGTVFTAYLALLPTERATHLLRVLATSEEALQKHLEHVTTILKSVKEIGPPATIDFTPPKGWTRVGTTSRWDLAENGKTVAFFSWSEPRESAGDDLTKQFAGFRSSWDSDWEVLKEGGAETFTNSTGLRGAAQARALKMKNGQGAVATFEALFLVDGRVHHFIFVTESYELYQKRLADELLPMLESAKKK